MYFSGHMIWMAAWWTFELIMFAVVVWALFDLFSAPAKVKPSSRETKKAA